MFGLDVFLAALYKKSAIKSIQRGVTVGAGDVTINAVNIDKTMVLSKSKGSAGHVAARGEINGSVSNVRYSAGAGGYNTTLQPGVISGAISGGDTNLTVKEYSAKLVDATTISCDGPVEWQVVEYA